MLQQTRVEAGIAYFERFTAALPDIPSLAAVEEQQLLKLWEGLGYYSRARNLKKAATLLMQEHNGQLPADFAALCRLPGLGEYSAGAIASIAFDIRVPAVDGNVLRVAARLMNDARNIEDTAVKKEFRQIVWEVLPQHRVGDFNQSLMELGALICLPNGRPLCESCPVRDLCQSCAAGTQLALPTRQKKPRRRKEEKTVLLLCRPGEVQIDIEDGEVQCGIAVRSKAGISLECGANSEKEFEKEKTVYERKLPNIEFNAGIVPIVITNHMEAVVGAAGSLEGGIHSSYGATADSTLGFQYDSRTGKVEEVKEGNLNSDGLEWSTVEVNGRLEAYIDIRLSAKLYDSAGLNLSGGAVGKAEGQAKVSMKDDLGGYAGSLELSISPRIKGKAVVDIPVIDKKMQETDLFDRTFDPIWSKHWESSADWQKDMEWTETGEQGDIYVTRYGEVNQCDSTAFQFEIPKGWEIQTEEVGGPMDAVRENVVLTNDRGVTVSFWYCQGALGGYSRDMLKAQVSQADTSNFVPGYPWGTDRDCSDLGEFMVARVHITGEMMAGIDDDYVPVDSTLFAVIPTGT